MKISADKKKALEALGYTVKGTTVRSKDGGTVASINENGNWFTGSAKVRGILKAKDAPAPKTPTPTKSTASRPRIKKEAPVAKDAMAGYRKGDVTTSRITASGGRGDGRVETIRRRSDAAIDRAEKSKTTPRARPAAQTPLQRISKFFSGRGTGYTQVPAKK